MNLGQIRTQASKFAGDPSQTRFSGSYDDAINRAQEQFAFDSKALFKDTSYTTTAADSTYDLPSDFMYEKWVYYNGLPLAPLSRETLRRDDPNDDWTDDAGTPTHYLIDPEEAVKTLRLYPIPQEAKSVSMRYYPLPASVSSDSDIPLNSSALMVQFHMGIAALAAWFLLTYEEQTPAILMKKAEIMKVYTDAVNKATETFKETASEPLRLRPERYR